MFIVIALPGALMAYTGNPKTIISPAWSPGIWAWAHFCARIELEH